MSQAAASRIRGSILLAAAILLSAGGAALAAAGPFTQGQVTAGRNDYIDNCSSCHGETLAGGGDAPPLTGANFANDWLNRSTAELYLFVSTSMPQGLEGDLDPKTYANIIAFLLAANGATPGPAPFTKGDTGKIGAIATGHMVPAVVNGGAAP